MKTMYQIAEEMVLKYDIAMSDLRSLTRGPDKHSAIRQEAMWLMTEQKDENGKPLWSYGQIGMFFNRQHSTVVDARKTYAKRMGIPLVPRK
jgi:chromosomal replication initiation ATPase DnaA